jgi:ADP-ribose pyrophosphatase YjhB (NUDIX family)
MVSSQPKDIFQRGLKRGAERLKFDPVKRYFFVEKEAAEGAEGWKVFLRSCCFIYERPPPGQAVDPTRFLVVRRAGAESNEKAWEPPKGQMEGKDGLRDPKSSIHEILRQNIKREVAEEARIKHLIGLEHTGLVYQGREKDYPEGTYFQYHIFRAMVTPQEYLRASEELQWFREHPLAFARLRRDKREKDMISWYVPSEHKLMGKWSPSIVAMMLAHFRNL